MRGIDIFQNPYYREISTMRGRTMRGLPVICFILETVYNFIKRKTRNEKMNGIVFSSCTTFDLEKIKLNKLYYRLHV